MLSGLTRQETREGDDFFSLHERYKSALPGSTPASFAFDIAQANGVPAPTAATIDNWVFSISGKRRPFNTSDNPGIYGGARGVGWAMFGAGDSILLPKLQGESVSTSDLKSQRIAEAKAKALAKAKRDAAERNEKKMLASIAIGALVVVAVGGAAYAFSKKGKK